MAEFRKASTDFRSAFEEEMRDLDRQAREVERKKAAEAASPPQPAVLATPSGDETQSSPAELASADTHTQGGEAPVITPVAESVARSAGPSAEASTAAQSPEEKTENAIATNPLDATHDHQQPA
jgi:hypothetical protein